MQNIISFIKQWEGGFVNDPADRGGATNMGVTLATFRHYFGAHMTVEHLKNITPAQWETIFRSGYYNPWKADLIENHSIRLLVVDWAWHSGATNSIRRVQTALGLVSDGIVGPKTLAALNDGCRKSVFDKIQSTRLEFFDAIVRNSPSQQKFMAGWRNRVLAIKFTCN